MAQAKVLSHGRMTRSRLFRLIESFEMDMRRVLLRYILDHLDEESALQQNFARADKRRAQDGVSTASIAEFLDLHECYEILNRHRSSLPSDFGNELKANTALVSELVPIRNRVMHGRPLSTGDPERAVFICSAFATRYWWDTQSTLTKLAEDPAWEPAFELQSRATETVLHNLPLPEYDETGLVGRSQECRKIVQTLKRRRDPVITVVGEGGIGKTAVALEAAYMLLDDGDCPYDCILWVSLKTERLTAAGVVSIADAARDVAGAASDLGAAMAAGFKGGVSELAEALEGIDALLIIDNLETVSAVEVMELYDTLPDSVNYLFTSRVGIGQVERRHELGPLQDKDARLLLRNFSKARGVGRLATLSESTTTEIVTSLRFSPLAIRWYVLSVEAGREPLPTLRDQDALLDFCVRSVYEQMGPEAKRLLAALLSIADVPSFEELAVLLDVPIDDLRRSAHALISGSMVTLEPDSENQLVSRVRLTEAAKQFLKRISPPPARTVAALRGREEELRQAEEARRADERGRSFAPNVVRTSTPSNQPAAFVLRQALLASRKNDTAEALRQVDRARTLDPDFWEVDRVEAFILSSVGQVEQATSRYEAALRNAHDPESHAVVSHFFAGHLARRAKQLDKALPYAEEAHSYFRHPETANALGNLLVWLGRFGEGQILFEFALERSTGQARLISLTSLAESWRRWSEHEVAAEHNPLEGFRKACTGFEVGSKEMAKGVYDLKLADNVLGNCGAAINAVTAGRLAPRDYGRALTRMLEFVLRHQSTFERCRSWQHFPARLYRFQRMDGDGAVRMLATRILEHREHVSKASGDGDALTGIVRNWRGTFGFIEHPDYPNNVFFPASVVENMSGRGMDEDLRGCLVNFEVETQSDGRVKATRVLLVSRQPAAN